MRRDKVQREQATSILQPNQNATNRQTRKRSILHQDASHRLRTRKLLQELDAVDENYERVSGSSADAEATAEVTAEAAATETCCKKKRAALELQRRQSLSESASMPAEPLASQQTRDRLLGALALMELSGVPISTEAVLREAEVLMPVCEAEKMLGLRQW